MSRDAAIINGLVRRLPAFLADNGGAVAVGTATVKLKAPRTDIWIAANRLRKQGKIKVTKVEMAAGAYYYKLSLPVEVTV